MIYKLFMWDTNGKFVALFPEIDPGDITVGINKEEVKIQAKVKAINTLKSMKELPDFKDLTDLKDIIEVLPTQDLIMVGTVNLDKEV